MGQKSDTSRTLHYIVREVSLFWPTLYITEVSSDNLKASDCTVRNSTLSEQERKIAEKICVLMYGHRRPICSKSTKGFCVCTRWPPTVSDCVHAVDLSNLALMTFPRWIGFAEWHKASIWRAKQYLLATQAVIANSTAVTGWRTEWNSSIHLRCV